MSGRVPPESLQIAFTLAFSGFLIALNAAIYFFVPISQEISLQPLAGGDTAISPTKKLLILGALGTFLIVALSLVRNPARWIISIILLIAFYAVGSFLNSKLNIALDEPMPKLVIGKLKEVSKESRYGKTLWALIRDENDQMVLITTRYDPSRKLIQVDGSSVTFFICEGYFKKPYICSNTPK